MKFTTLEKILALMVVATILMTIVISFVPNLFLFSYMRILWLVIAFVCCLGADDYVFNNFKGRLVEKKRCVCGGRF